MQKIIIHLLILVIIVQSCFPEDERVPPYPYSVTTISDSVQKYQSYFDLETGIVIKSHSINTWQLGFETGIEGNRIITNSGADWFIYNTNQKLPSDIFSMPVNLTGLYDIQSMWPDSTAVGNWNKNSPLGNDIYILGKNTGGSFKKMKQIVFLENNDTSYRFFYKEKDTGYTDTVLIKKKNDVNFVYYSFETKKQEDLEPPKTDYDLIFTSYYDMATLFERTMPYKVGGALLNVWQTEAAIDSVTLYHQITFESLPDYDFTNQRDIPGYKWKSVSVDISGGGIATYTVKPYISYLFKTAQNNYYKLHFLSYSLNGSSGHPRFEYSLLE